MSVPRYAPRIVAALAIIAMACTVGADVPPSQKTGGAKTPQEEQRTFQLAPGFRIELVACEPQVMDPVALAFDQDGRLYVAEMRGYPNDGYGTGNIASGCIKLLEDRDGDGFYETASLFADGLRFPTSILPWKKGILVSVAPELIYLEDTDGDGKADVKRVLYTGFGIDNIQQLLNSLQWGLDNWVYACNGASGGNIRSVEKPDMPLVSLGNRGIRFHPEIPGRLEPMSGGGQFGLAPDAWQHWFTATNSQHLRQIILPDHYLRRNPGVAAPNPTHDIPEHGPACKVFRISPFEAWRVERTTRRAGSADASRFPKTELVPGGFVTSACSPVVYEAERFPDAYRGNVYICEPANNLILRDRLEDDGPIFRAKRADNGKEFLASTDNWFRPVNLSLGPDGALYVVDFYREVIETPRSLPDDMKPKLVLRSQECGRIWRIVPEDHVRGRPPRLSRAASRDLIPLLAEPNLWWRLTTQRLLIERQDKAVGSCLRDFARKIKSPSARVHALWTLHGLGSLDDELIGIALQDSSASVREQGLRLAEDRLDASQTLRELVTTKLAMDPAPRVRMQAAFSLGESRAPEAAAALVTILQRDADDPWIRAAVLSSAARVAPAMLDALTKLPEPVENPGQPLPRSEIARQLGLRKFAGRLAAQIGAAGSDADRASLLEVIAATDRVKWQVELLDGLGQGLQNASRPLDALWKNPPEVLKPAVARLRQSLEAAVRVARDETRPVAERLSAIQRLTPAPFDLMGSALAPLLSPAQPDAIQVAAVVALARHENPGLAPILLGAWPTASPGVRGEIQEALFARPERVASLLDAIEQKKVLPQQLDVSRIDQLKKLANKNLRDRAERLLASAVDVNRQKAVDLHKDALSLRADAEKGRAVFRKVCATCHRLENVGTEVGPDLLAALRDKTSEQLLVSILDPSREVDRRFSNYVIETKSGRSVSGLVAAESATSITLRRAERVEETILRQQIESIADTGKSLMPDGLEQQLSKQDVADVIAYLRAVK